jgi:Spy/CpxP family protein refolding chaperone
MGRGPIGPRLGGKWWDNPETAKRVGITSEQQKKMDEVFQQSRLKLIDLTAALQKEEVVMDGLMQNPQLDDAKILPVADRIAEARAELEKTNVRMLLGIRHVLTPEQWTKVEAEHPDRPRPARGGRDNVAPPAPGPRPFEE